VLETAQVKYVLDILLDENGKLNIYRGAVEIEAESEEEAHEQAISQFRKLYPRAAIAVATADATRH
jgi:hypothetical protein